MIILGPPISECFGTELCEALFTNQRLSIDESMIAYKGRLSFKQYLPAKPTKYGSSFFCHMRFDYRLLYAVRDLFRQR